MRPRIILLVSSPRLPAGLLTAAAWDAVRAHPVLAGAEHGLTVAVRAAGVRVTVVDDPVPALLATVTGTAGQPGDAPTAPDPGVGSTAPPDPGVGSTARPAGAGPIALETAGSRPAAPGDSARHGAVVWLTEPGGDEPLARQLGLTLARTPGTADLEILYGSWDPPGARLLDAVAVIDRLLSPGGDPWKRAQTHASLAQFLIEECYEAYDAIVSGDLDALRGELGDVLLQVVLHARLAEELPPERRWSVDDVAGTLVAKLIRRSPHVFAGAEANTLEEITDNWEQIKRAEQPRESVLDGIPSAQPALSLAAKMLQRLERAGLTVPLPDPAAAVDEQSRLGATLLATVARARVTGLDAEAALRRAALDYADRARAVERSQPEPGPD